ncbi:MAG TPA: sulfotransferase, partial [Actinoplanes sp.]|nr:sulfotransferase [Actinoplanes sp.]
VRYEEFVADPRGVLATVADFAGHPVTEQGLAFASDTAVELTAQHTVSGNPVRFTTGRVVLRRDEAWRTELPIGQQRAVSLLAYPLLRRYGYPLVIRPE